MAEIQEPPFVPSEVEGRQHKRASTSLGTSGRGRDKNHRTLAFGIAGHRELVRRIAAVEPASGGASAKQQGRCRSGEGEVHDTH